MRRVFLSVGLFCLVLVAATPVAAAAPLSGEGIRDYQVNMEVDSSGVLHVAERIDYVFTSPHHGIYRDIPTSYVFDDTYDRVTPLSVTAVDASGGAPAGYVIEDIGGGWKRIKIGDPDVTVTGEVTYTIVYELSGALNGFSDHDEIYWNAVGHEWDVPVADGSVKVKVPSEITAAACYQGPDLSNLPCPRGAHLDETARRVSWTFSDLAPNDGITVAVGFEKGAVPEPEPILVERWTLTRAFTMTPATGGAAAAVLFVGVGAFVFLFWRKGRDRRFAGGAVAAAYGRAGDEEENVPISMGGEMPLEFEPPDGIRPGQVGTLIDEVANPLDVTATVVDLAVRKYLVIEEIPKQGWLGKPDWKLTKLKDADNGLLTYEKVLLNGLFEDGEEVLLSDLKTAFVARLKKVQESLYADATNRKWFDGRPDKVRTRWIWIGVATFLASIGLAVVLVAATRLGLVAVSLVVIGLVFVFGARLMPRRTAKGTAMVGRVMGFRRFIESPTQVGLAQLDESENVFSAYLPYAIVFDLTEKWAKAFEALAAAGGAATGTYYWYRSAHPFALSEFGSAMSGFTTATAGTIASVPASSGSSGFSGGSSGGGFGGGGGGSW